MLCCVWGGEVQLRDYWWECFKRLNTRVVYVVCTCQVVLYLSDNALLCYSYIDVAPSSSSDLSIYCSSLYTNNTCQDQLNQCNWYLLYQYQLRILLHFLIVHQLDNTSTKVIHVVCWNRIRIHLNFTYHVIVVLEVDAI